MLIYVDRQKYQICGIVFEITLYSKKYVISDLFDSPEPYNLYINYHILKYDDYNVDEKIIINDTDNTSVDINEEGLIINTDISKIVQKNYSSKALLL